MMNFKSVLLSVSALTFVFATPVFAQTSSIGVNAAVKGDVTVATDEQSAKQAVVKDPVFLGQMINAKRLSSLQVLLKDQTVFTVGPDCSLTIDKFVYDPTKNNSSLGATVQKGMFRFMSGNVSRAGADKVTIDTPVGSMGIRGTMVEGVVGPEATAIAVSEGILPGGIAVDPAGATLVVLRGPGPNRMGTNRKGEISVTSGGQTVIITGSNQAVFVPNANVAPIVFTLSQTAYQNFSQNLRTVPTSPNTYNSFEIDQHFNTQVQASQPTQQTTQPQTAQASTGTSTTGTSTTTTGTATGAGTAGTSTGTIVGTAGTGAAGGLGVGTIALGLAAIAGMGFVIVKDEDNSN